MLLRIVVQLTRGEGSRQRRKWRGKVWLSYGARGMLPSTERWPHAPGEEIRHAERKPTIEGMSMNYRRTFLKTAAAAAMTWPALARADGPAKPRIKIGQIGTGHGHATKLAVYRKSPDYEVIGLVEPDEALRKRMATQAAFKDVPIMTRE